MGEALFTKKDPKSFCPQMGPNGRRCAKLQECERFERELPESGPLKTENFHHFFAGANTRSSERFHAFR